MAVGDAHVFPGFLTPVLTQLFFPRPPTTFLTCFCTGERRNYAGKKVASTGDRTHNHQVMSPTRSPLRHPSGGLFSLNTLNKLPKLKFQNTDVTLFENHKHLGITFSKTGQWNVRIDNVIKSPSKVLGLMRKLKFTLNRRSLTYYQTTKF